MPLRRTKRSDGHQRPRWKDGSHAKVENTDAEQSRCDGLAFELNFLSEPLKRVRLMLGPNHERNVSTRDRPARTGADARIEGSEANGEVRLATRPYGRRFPILKISFGTARNTRTPTNVHDSLHASVGLISALEVMGNACVTAESEC